MGEVATGGRVNERSSSARGRPITPRNAADGTGEARPGGRGRQQQAASELAVKPVSTTQASPSVTPRASLLASQRTSALTEARKRNKERLSAEDRSKRFSI